MDSTLVYSTGQGRMCPDCNRKVTECICKQSNVQPKGSGAVRVFRDTKGRKGKCVTVITGLPLTNTDCIALAKELKRNCGSGGTVKETVIEIQGDHRDRLVQELNRLGFKAKSAGG